MDLLTLEEVILVNYLLRGSEQDTEVLIRDQFRPEFARLSLSNEDLPNDYAQATNLAMLIVKLRPFPVANTLTGVAAGCITLMMNGYKFFVGKDEIDNVVVMIDSGTWTWNKLHEWFERNAE